MTPRRRLKLLAERINALSLRERGLLLLAVVAIIFLAWDFTFLQPLGERRESVSEELQAVRARVDDLTGSLQELAGSRSRDPNRELERQRDALTEEVRALETRLAERHAGVATARDSIGVLAGLLARQAGVDVVSLENLEPERLMNSAGDPVPGLYIHRVRIVIESDFAGIGDYLQRTETLPQGVFWEAMRLSVPDWPTNRVELTLFSISLNEQWLGV